MNGHNHAGDFDAFDHILQVTNHQESVYAYYYMDETNKVKVTEIFDMTEDNAVNNFNEKIQNFLLFSTTSRAMQLKIRILPAPSI